MTSKELLDIFIKYPEVLTDHQRIDGLLKDIFPNEKSKIKIISLIFNKFKINNFKKESQNDFFWKNIQSYLINDEALNPPVVIECVNLLSSAIKCFSKMEKIGDINGEKLKVNDKIIHLSGKVGVITSINDEDFTVYFMANGMVSTFDIEYAKEYFRLVK